MSLVIHFAGSEKYGKRGTYLGLLNTLHRFNHKPFTGC